MIRIAIVGAAGRMGRELIQLLHEKTDVTLGAATEYAGSSFIGVDAGELAGVGKVDVNIVDDLAQVMDELDVLIDFSTPDTTMNNLKLCRQHGKKMIIGTTGLTEQQSQQIKDAGVDIAIVMAANFSIGVNLMLKLVENAAKVMGSYCDIEIIEAHHRHKVDAPSGTALAIGESISQAMNQTLADHALFCREGLIGARPAGQIGFSTVRAGDIVGEHTALFADIGERIEITHKASSRKTFATGAVRAAIWLNDHQVGFYTMKEVLALHEF